MPATRRADALAADRYPYEDRPCWGTDEAVVADFSVVRVRRADDLRPLFPPRTPAADALAGDGG